MAIDKRRRLLKRFSLVPIGMLSLGMLGPFLLSLFKQFSDGEFSMEVCVSTPDPHQYSSVILIAFFVWLIAFLPIYVNLVVNAVYVRFVLWSGGVAGLLIFNLIAVFGVECLALTSVEKFLSYAIPPTLIGAFIFVYLMRNRLKRAIEINKHAFDFENMRWEITAPMVHVDEKVNSSTIATWTVAAGFLGLLIAKLPVASWFGFPQAFNDWALIIFAWSIGAFCAAGYGGADLYVLWLVWRRGRREGKSMLTAELIEKRG